MKLEGNLMKILKGNYEVKAQPKIEKKDEIKPKLNEKFRKKAIENIGGSMVFVERKTMLWDGSE